jgi:integrase
MQNHNYKNETIKRKYYKYLQNSKGYSAKSIECFKKAIWLWQEFTNNNDFIYFNQTKVEEFKEWLKDKNKKNSQEKVGLSYRYDILRYLKLFFDWLSKQSGYKSKINETAVDYLNLTRGEVKIATQPRTRQIPALEEAKTLIESIKGNTEIEMRDKALISLIFLTGARISAIASLPIESFDREKLIIDQDPKLGVKTKNSKRIITALITFSYKEPLDYFLGWFDYLVGGKKFKPNDPIFPATKTENGKDNNIGYYNTDKVEPVFWKSSASPRKIFENRSERAGIKYYHPHTFRHLLVNEVSKLPLSEEQRKAISQNLGHEDVGTTFGSYGYGNIGEERQIEIIRNIDFSGKKNTVSYNLSKDELKELAKELKQDD